MAAMRIAVLVLTVGTASAASNCRAGRTITNALLGTDDVQHLSLAINSNGEAVMAHYDAVNRNLVVTTCDGGPCLSVTKAILDEAGDVGLYPAIAVLRTVDGGFPIVSYHDATETTLKVAVCNNVRCTNGATISIIDGGSDATGDVGLHTSIAVLPTGLAVIAYVDATHGVVKVAACSDLLCTSAARSGIGAAGTADGAGTHGTSIAVVPGTGLPLVAFQQAATGSDLRVAACVNPSCSLSAVYVLDSTVDARFPAVTAQGGAGSHALVAFVDATTRSVRVASCLNDRCAVAVRVTVDEDVDVDAAIGLATLPDGRGLLAYFASNTTTDIGSGTSRLRLAVCSNLPCDEFTLIADAESAASPTPAPTHDASGNSMMYEHHRRRRAMMEVVSTDVATGNPLHGRRLPHRSPTRAPATTNAPTFAPSARFGELVDRRAAKVAAFKYGPFFVGVQRGFRANAVGDLTAVVCANSLCECRAAKDREPEEEKEPASGVAFLVILLVLVVGAVSFVASATGHCEEFHAWRRRLSEQCAGRLEGEQR